MSAQTATTQAPKIPWWLILIGGILNIIIGASLLAAPVKTTYALVIALGIYWVIGGIFTLVSMFMDHTSWGWKLFTGAISLIAGLAILEYPLMSTFTIPSVIILVLGLQGIIVGIVSIFSAFKGGGWSAGILGVLGILFGGLLVANYNDPALIVTLVWFAAGFLLAGGVIQIIMAFRVRKA
jgi:uncharacterized membrane protein HdeD (DUF308 family)